MRKIYIFFFISVELVTNNFIYRGNHPNVTVKAWGEIMGLIDPDAGNEPDPDTSN
jgi:hypothetical protein